MAYPVGRFVRVLLWLVSAIVAAILTIVALYLLPRPTEEERTPQLLISCDIPAEVLCRVAATPDEVIPEAVTSDKPLLRLREYAPGQYELLYWGNPVRPHYTFSITKISSRKSVLYSTDGKPEQQRNLPVTHPRRKDGKLPLQPVTKLHGLEADEGLYYAAKVSVHDGTTGKILCSEVYIISCGSN